MWQNRITQYCEINFLHETWKCEFKAWEQKGHPQFTLDIILIDESLEDENYLSIKRHFFQCHLFCVKIL